MLIKTERYLKKKDILILTNQSCASKMMLIILQLITIFQALFRGNNSFYYVSLILRIINRFKMSLCNYVIAQTKNANDSFAIIHALYYAQ